MEDLYGGVWVWWLGLRDDSTPRAEWLQRLYHSRWLRARRRGGKMGIALEAMLLCPAVVLTARGGGGGGGVNGERGSTGNAQRMMQGCRWHCGHHQTFTTKITLDCNSLQREIYSAWLNYSPLSQSSPSFVVNNPIPPYDYLPDAPISVAARVLPPRKSRPSRLDLTKSGLVGELAVLKPRRGCRASHP